MNNQKIFFITLLSITSQISAMVYYDFHLRSAALRNDTKTVTACIRQRIDINAQDEDGNTALHGAAFKGNTDVTEILLKHKASVYVQNKHECTPLNMAINSQHENRDCTRMILKVELADHANLLCERLKKLT
jgi:ankyrin repeat protein